MKRSALVLLTFFAITLVGLSPMWAQTPPATAPSASSAAATQELQRFLATLSADQKQAPAHKDQEPAAAAALNACTSNTDCATGQLCCNVCGADLGDGRPCKACVNPIRGNRCPLVVSSPSRPSASFIP